MYFQNTPITMEEQFKKQDDILKKLLKESPLESPSVDFSKKVMQQIERKHEVKVYSPLISKTAWTAIAAMFLLSLVWIYYNPSSTVSSTTIALQERINIENPLKGFTLSKTTIYAVGFMALFLFQIPFLKRITERS